MRITYFDQFSFLETTYKHNKQLTEEGEDGNKTEEKTSRENPLTPVTQLPYTVWPKTTRKRGSRCEDDELIPALKKNAAQDAKENNDNKDEGKPFLLSLLSEIIKKKNFFKYHLKTNYNCLAAFSYTTCTLSFSNKTLSLF